MDATTIGVLGLRWRATVTSAGSVEPWPDDLDDPGASGAGRDGTGQTSTEAIAPERIEWFVAADDRWHVPEQEPSVRQRRIEGTPVLETRVRIPQGDAVQRVYAVADLGGATVFEFENESPMPIAVALTGAAEIRTVRPPVAVPVEGIDLPGPAHVFPIGHRASLTVVVPNRISASHAPGGVTGLPAGLPTPMQVARGWLARAERGGRIVIPDEESMSAVVGVRCALLLHGPDHPADDPIGFLLTVDQLVRAGERAHEWMPDVAEAVALLVRHRSDPLLGAALDAAQRIATAADEQRANRDLERIRRRLSSDQAVTAPRIDDLAAPSDVRTLVRLERALAADGDLLGAGIPSAWWGQSFEVYGLPTGASTTISYAVRWHGARPAVLWEQTGGSVELRAAAIDPAWHTTAAAGETLWSAPSGAPIGASGDDVSFV